MPKVLLLVSRNAEEYRRLLDAAQLPELELTTTPGPECEVAFGEPALIREALPHLPRLKWAQAIWAGVEPLMQAGLRRDYVLTNARSVFGPLMSEYVFAYLLLHERKVLQRLENQQEAKWDKTITGTVRGKTMGLLGVGSIGAHVASTAKHFGMTVHGFTRSSESSPVVDGYFHEDLPAFAAGVDYLVCILPNTPATRHLVDASVIAALPPHALLVNAGRGATLDEAALAQALSDGRIAAAVLDVFEQEPLPADHVFWRTPNLFITSHTAAPSFPSDIAEVFVENYMRYLNAEQLKYRVDFERGY
ncbi:MAG: D-2-hydroxyacid dehydrogenase [Bacteroidota bacterium]